MGHTNARDNARGANRAWPNANFYRISARINQRFCAIASGNIAGNHRNLIGDAFDPCHLFQHSGGMAVGSINHHTINPRIHQMFGALKALIANACCGANAQAPFRVFASIGVARCLFHILHRHKPNTTPGFINHHQLFNAVLMEQPPRFILAHTFTHTHNLARHQLIDWLARVIGKAHIAIGENANEAPRLTRRRWLDNGNARDGVIAHNTECFLKRSIRRDGDGVHHHAALKAFDAAHIFRLLGGCEIAMDNAHTAFLRHGNRHARLSHRVHGGR